MFLYVTFFAYNQKIQIITQLLYNSLMSKAKIAYKNTIKKVYINGLTIMVRKMV